MNTKKHKKIIRIFSALCVAVIAFFALAVPMSAVTVVNKSEYFNVGSTFPLSVGFGYAHGIMHSAPENSYEYPNPYVLVTDIGRAGNNYSSDADDCVDYFNYDMTVSGTEISNIKGNIRYNNCIPEFRYRIVVGDDSDDYVARGLRTYDLIPTGRQYTDSNGDLRSADMLLYYTFAADEVFYNPAWLLSENTTFAENNDSDIAEYMLPYISLPHMQDVKAFYDYECTFDVITSDGRIDYDYDYWFTATNYPSDPDNLKSNYCLLPVDVLRSYTDCDTICIANFEARMNVVFYVKNSMEQWERANTTQEEELPLDYTSLTISLPFYDTSNVSSTTDSDIDYQCKYSFPDMDKFMTYYDYNAVIPEKPSGGTNIETIDVDFTSWLGTAVGGFLNFKIFPNFSIVGILGILISFSLVLILLKWLG